MRGLFNIRGLALGACLLWGAYGSTAQSNRLSTAIKIEQQSKTPVSLALFEISSANDVRIDQEIKKVTYLKLNKDALQALRQQGHSLISFQLPVDGILQDFTLYNYNILDGGFKVYERGTDGIKKQVAHNPGSFFRGAITAKESSLAAFSFYDDDIAAVFSTLDGGNYNLVLNYGNPGAARDNYILFREADVLTARTAKCGVTEDMYKVEQEENVGAKNMYNTCNKLRVSLHADYRLYTRRNSSTTSVTNYLTSLFNAISVLFNNEGINAVVSEIVINNAPDGYTYGGSDEVLEKFGEVMQTTTLDGDIAQMVSGYRQGGWAPLGGLAWLDVLCNAPNQFPNGNGGTTWAGPYSMSNNEILNNIPQIPMYSWDVNASIHEMGHNIGSPHTQSCSWPGGAIDDCYPTEGTCAAGPTPVDGGTIMSYCHLSGPGINFALGFGPLPGQRIRNRMASKACLTSFVPDKTLAVAATTRIANKECTAGSWTSYFFDNNTADESDDELLLMIRTNSQNIGNVDTAGFEIKMITTQQYSTGAANSNTVPYAQGDWKEINRSWVVTLPSGSQPASNVSIRFPFTNQDVQDVSGSAPSLTQATQFSAVAFKNQTAANNPGTATAANVSFYTNGSTADASHWVSGTTGNYSYAEIVSNYGIYGGTLGFDADATSIGKVKQRDLLNIYPNPATTELFIQIPSGLKTGQQFVEVFDNLGRMVKKESIVHANGSYKMGVSNLSQGVYTIRYVQGDKTFNAMFVKK